MRRFAPPLLAVLLTAAVVCLYWVLVRHFVDPEALLAHRDALQAAAASQPVMALAAFAAAYIASTALALPCGGVLGLLAGLLFGRWLGLGIVLIAGTISALIVYGAARSTLGERLRRRAGPLHTRLSAAMQENAFAYLLFMRIVPLFPFFVVTLVAALLGVRARTFVLATILGKIPVNFIYAMLGHEIGRATSLQDLMRPEFFVGLTALGALALAPVIYRRLRPRQKLLEA
jgi:uncharacterized membrane protein YdjX (TVP38/TMEM64 family)